MPSRQHRYRITNPAARSRRAPPGVLVAVGLALLLGSVIAQQNRSGFGAPALCDTLRTVSLALDTSGQVTAPGIDRRLAAIRARGGRVVLVDPRRTETAAKADTHLFIRPGSDAAFLLSIAHVWLGEGGLDLGRAADLVEVQLGCIRSVPAQFV